MVKKISKDLSEYKIPISCENYSLIDVTDSFVKLLDQNSYFLPDSELEYYLKLKTRYSELRESIKKYLKGELY